MPEMYIDRIKIAERRAVRNFITWLYEEGPNPDTVTRDRLASIYYAQRAEKAMIEGVTRYVPQDGELPLLRPTD